MNQKQAAEALGYSVKSLQTWRKEPGFPDVSKGWDVAKIRSWLKERSRKIPEDEAAGRKLNLAYKAAQVRKIAAEASRKEREEEEAKGNLLRRDKYEAFLAEVTALFRGRLYAIPKQIAALVPAEMRTMVIEEGLRVARQAFEEWARAIEAGPGDDD